MRNILNDKKTEKTKQIRSKKGLWQRILSFITVFALVTNTMYSGELFGLFDFSTVMTVKAEGETPSYNITYGIDAFPDTTSAYTFDNTDAGIKMFCDYCYHYNTNDTFASKHIDDSLAIIFTEISESYGFMGLGNAKVPFAGYLRFMADTNGLSNIYLPRALFSHVSTDAKITDTAGNEITLAITKNSSASSPLLADYVHLGTDPANWKIKVASGSNAFAGVIGQLEEKAKVLLEFDNQSSAAVSNTAEGDDIKDVGELCGIMKAGSSLTVTDNTTTRPAVTSSEGNAGSLVGKMEGNASLTLVAYPNFTGVSVTSTSGYAGGLVGETTSAATITFTGLSSPLDVGGTITGTTGAGGLYGHYINSASTFNLKDYNITATVYAENCGGVFGVLENKKGESETATSLTIQNKKNAETIGTVAVQSGNDSTYADTGYFGGIVGKYTTDDLSNSLILDGLTISATSQASFASFGGAIGLVGSAAYVKADGLNVTATNTAKRDASGFFGGLVGTTSTEKGVFIDLGSFKLTVDSNGFKGGGVIGSFKNGVLRLSGTTDMASANASRGGQLVGENDNVLVYALGTGTDGTAYGSGWTFKRSNGSQIDDLGTWGEVVRLAAIEDTTDGILTLDPTTHTVTIKAAKKPMGTPADFAKTALNIQLNQGVDYDCLKFEVVDDARTTRASLLREELTLVDDISLVGTGILGFMRDGSDSIGEFIGTLNGGSHTVSLAIGEKYGQEHTGVAVTSESTSEGIGQIYRHPYNGLFAFIGNGTTGTGTVKSLNIGGSINVRNKIDGMNIGGIAAVSRGNTTLDGITASQTINYGEPSAVTGTDTSGKNIGGLIGLASNGTDNGTISITGNSTISTNFIISGYYNSWNALGAAIGKVTSPKFTINIAQGADDTLTVSHTMVDNSGFTAGENSDGGGLIGYITSGGEYSNRKVNIKNLDFNNCTIINKATKNGGGFLGYAWLDTDTTIDGLTVTDGTITNSSPNVGVMCYEATGRWKVNNLTVTKMSMPAGAGTSLGMLVNKAYNKNNGLYLDVLKAGYTLMDKSGSTGITLPNDLTIYDELAAESAKDVITGTYKEGNTTYRAGVVSINMNSGRHNPEAEPADNNSEARISETGTYQNQLTSASSAALNNGTYANPKTRYYYNLDVLDSGKNNNHNILLWSVEKYAADNIKTLFKNSVSDNTLTGTADMTGLSFYPIPGTEDYSLDGLTLTMGYSSVYDAEKKVQTDDYVRDAALVNQHYLMQSGLFTSLSNSKKLTIKNSNTLKGDFLEISDVSGVLISGTSNGSIVSSTGSSLVLDGIVAKTTEKKDYNDGYLLVNNIERVNSINSADNITIRLEGISTTDTYSSGVSVAKSLLGAASGANLNIEFSKIKLDSRTTGTLSDNSALNKAYGTTHSIFTQSTLLDSICTDDKAQLKYYYTIAEDWGSTGTDGARWVTYGKEITDSNEYRENDVSLENKYDGSSYYTDPINFQSTSPYDFHTGFLPYVVKPFEEAKTNELYYRELKVNVSAEGLTSGCGTYNDPYIITEGKQLTTVSRFLSSGSPDELSKVVLPKNRDKYAGIEKSTTGSRWCDKENTNDYHAEFTLSGEDYVHGTGDSAITWSKTEVQYYLANAYYKIENDIVLSGDLSTGFVGLGGKSANTAFRGVIVGDTNDDNTPRYCITNNSVYPFVNVSNGCVIKDVNILVNAENISLTQSAAAWNNAYFGYNSACEYYGGIIGEIMGGDNIIDNSYVKYSYTDNENKEHTTTITLTDSGKNNQKYGTIVPVGGYVGVVVFGGLVFKNMTVVNTTIDYTKLKVTYKTYTYNLADNSAQEAWAAIYVNPIVGRVINGYAVNETTKFSVDEDGKYQDADKSMRFSTEGGDNADLCHTLKNGTKHYTIADINKDETNKLSVTPPTSTSDGEIKIPNSQAFFILSLITQSTSGTAQTADGDYNNSLSYGTVNSSVYGMSHNAGYSDVGTTETDSNKVEDYKLVSYDTADIKAVPYIIRKYTAADSNGDYPARCVTSTLGYYNIELTAPTPSYSYQLPDSFRGLGSVGFYDSKSPGNNNQVEPPDENGKGKMTDGTSDGWKYRATNKFSIKLNTFEGKSFVIDIDIYLNKYLYDNYFNKLHSGENGQFVNEDTSDYHNENSSNKQMHGIGLFDSVITKNADSSFSNFTLSGSVHTQVFNNEYTTTQKDQEKIGVNTTSGQYVWLSTGGVCGWGISGLWMKFSNIQLNNLSVRGATTVGGLLASSGNKSKTYYITCEQCSATNLKLDLSVTTSQANRAGIGAFVGKVKEGGVRIYGTEHGKENTDISKYSVVEISSFTSIDKSSVISGGLVGYAGNGCQVYDMRVKAKSGSKVTIGTSEQFAAGGIVGLMQPVEANYNECFAEFINCEVQEINVIAKQYAGGFYGGTWNKSNPIDGGFSGANDDWTIYKINIQNCKMLGNSAKNNTITATNGIAGGFIADAFVIANAGTGANIEVANSLVSHYTIAGGKHSSASAGGFLGYANAKGTNSVVCYIHDSSVENCTLGASGKFAGGVIGEVAQNTENKLIGYNVKLDKITSGTDKMGAWIGKATADTADKVTKIQFAGLAIYGTGFQKNVGNDVNLNNASFVFADYDGTDETTSVSVYQEGDKNSVTEEYFDKATDKTITQIITTITVNDDKTETTTTIQTNVLHYGTVSKTEVDAEETIETNKTTWFVDQTTGSIKRTEENATSQKVTKTTYTIAVSGYNDTNNVAMPKYPYVNINPQSSMGEDEIISGDGAVLRGSPSTTDAYCGKTAEKTMALKIYEDTEADSGSQNYSRRYSTFGTFNDTDAAKIYGENKIDYYMKRTITDDGDRISTYYTEKGITQADSPGYDDFACVVIANNTTEETTALINRYAQLVTNTTTDYAGTDSNNHYFNIVVESCKLENGKFVVDPSATPGLNYLNGQFSLIGSSADSLSSDTTFTLVDIQFMDPLTVGTGTANEKIAYHLYIPVYTIKEIEVAFSAAVMNGTNSVSYNASMGTEINNPYGEKLATATSDTHVDSLDTWYTTYIRYTYSRADLMALLASGNLNWNHNKVLFLDKTSHVATSMLPENTYMVLVDPNGDHDKKYQASLNATDFTRSNVTATTGRITFDLTKFSASDNTHFNPSTFNEMIAKKIIAVENTKNTGKYILYTGEGAPENTGDTHYVYTEASDGTRTFYEYVGTGGGWDLSLPDDYELNESYYISMYVPTPSSGNPLYGYFVRTPDKFDAPSYPSGTNNAITKSAKVNCYYGNNSNTLNRQVYIGNLFNQETELVVLPNDLEIDTGNRTLNIYAKTTIRPRNLNSAEILKAVNADIYHAFNIYLDRKGEDRAITNTIYGLENNGTDIQAWYSIGTEIPIEATDMSGFTSINKDGINLQDSYINVSTVKGGQTLLQNGGVTVYSRIRLEFASDDLAQQFPQRVANDTGVSVRAASNLAYDSASLAFSSMSAPAEEPVATKHIYYRQSLDSASLNYYAKTEPDSFDADGLPSENLSRLGVNGRYSMNDCMPVNSTAQYNISSIDSAAEDAEKLYLTLTLQKKTDTPAGGPYTAATYQNVSNINSYWGAVQRNETTHEVAPNAAGKPVTVANTTNVHIKCGNYDEVIEVPANSTSIQIEIPRNVPASSETAETLGYLVDENGYIYIDVGFNAKTGENFTEYANYKVNISVRLLDNEDKEIAGSYAGDYLIYTNAKVNHDFLKDN